VAVAIYIIATLPPRSIALTTPAPPTVLFGAYHVHTQRSDGAQSVDDITRAAARANLRFVILTDHGDATRAPDPPVYRNGVLVIDAVEISTAGGHVVAMGLEKASPYPLGGAAPDVIDDIHRLGGWAVVAHPDSPKPDLRWSAWTTGYDAVEWLNADSEWRDESPGRLGATILRSVVRGPESVATLFSRPTATLARWDAEAARRPIVGLAAIDAHGSLPLSGDTLFRAVSQGVELDQELSGDAGDDARRVMDGLRRGRTFTIVAATAAPAAIEFSAAQSGITVSAGGRLSGLTAETTFRAAVPGAPDARLELLLNGRPLQAGKGSVGFVGPLERGAYRVEVTLGDSSMPWILSNPIYAGETAPEHATASGPPVVRRTQLPLNRQWSIEHSAASGGGIALEGDDLRFAFQLGDDPAANPYAAVVAGIEAGDALQTIEFVGRADRPMRIVVQVRMPGGGPEGLRWRRSVYLNETPRTIVIPLTEFEPVDTAAGLRLTGLIRSLLFVADTVNSAPGARGTVWLSHVTLGSHAPPE